jgi:protein O-mannosyl-transferase
MSKPTTTGPSPHNPQRVSYALMVALFVLTLALYWPATGNDFLAYDDADYVTSNPQVQAGLSWAGVKSAFSTPTSCNWHPVTMLSHSLDCQLFGLKPWGHHLSSLLLHALNAVLLFALLRRLTGSTWRSFWVAALFALHPLRVESVAWVAERKDVLSGCFGLLTLLLYTRYAQAQLPTPQAAGKAQSSKAQVPPRPSHLAGPAVPSPAPGTRPSLLPLTQPAAGWYWLALVSFALGLMSKAMLVTWPFVLLLLDYWPLGRLKFRSKNAECRSQNRPAPKAEPSNFNLQPSAFSLLFEKLPFLALAALASVVTFMVQQHGGAVVETGDLPLGLRCSNALISYCRYLGKLCWPTDLAVFYPHPQHWPWLQVLWASGVLLGLSGLVWAQRRRWPFLLVGWLWYLGTLVPVLGLVQVGQASLADRYTYLPLIGVLVLGVWGAQELTRGSRYLALAFSAVGAVALLVCLGLTRQQLGYWKDSETLFGHSLAVTPDSAVTHLFFADALKRKGCTEAALSHLQETVRLKPTYAEARYNLGVALVGLGRTDEAIREYQEAIHLQPDYFQAHNNLGAALAAQGQNDEAIAQYQEAIRLQPDYVLAHNNLGSILLRQGQTDAAIGQYQEVARLRPDSAEVHNDLGKALFRKGQWEAARQQFQAAVGLQPSHAEAHFNLGTALAIQGHLNEAIGQFQETLRLNPDHADAHYNLGTALARTSQMAGAIHEFQEALRLQPEHAGAHYNLGVALSQQHQLDEAISQFQETVRLRPEHALAHNHLGTALLEKGQIEEAISHFRAALRLKPDYAEAQQNLARALQTSARAGS